MSFTLLDGILVASVLISALLGFLRGISREFFGIVCFALAMIVAYVFASQYSILEWVRPTFRYQLGGVFVGSAAVIFLMAAWIANYAMSATILAPDKLLGLLFGIARGLFLFVFAVAAVEWFLYPRDIPGWFKAAQSRELTMQYVKVWWPKEWTGLRLLLHPFVIAAVAGLYLTLLTDLIAAATRPFRVRYRAA